MNPTEVLLASRDKKNGVWHLSPAALAARGLATSLVHFQGISTQSPGTLVIKIEVDMGSSPTFLIYFLFFGGKRR